MNIVSRALLAAQRRGWRAPRPIVALGRRVLQRGATSAPPIDDWDTSLTGPQALGPAPESAACVVTVEGGLPPALADLRCLLVTEELDVGGSDEVLAFLARRLPNLGIETMVSFPGAAGGRPGGRLAASLRDEGVQIVEATPDDADALIEACRPDVISAHGAPDWWREAAARHDVPYVPTLHGMHNFFGADWVQEAARSASMARIVAVSELVRRQYLAGNTQVDPETVVTVPNSVDDRRVARLDRAHCRRWLGLEDEFLFVSLARYSVQKNTYGLVRAFAAVAAQRSHAHLLVAGRTDDAAYAQQVALLRNGLPSRDRIHLREHAPWPGVLLAAADAFVLDSFFEGWSLASMEALAAGVPVILSDVGGAREQVAEVGRYGRIVANPLADPLAVDWDSIGASLYTDQPNREELTLAMCEMVDAREMREPRHDEIRAAATDRFAPHRAVAGHAAVLRDAVALRDRTEAGPARAR